MIICRACLEQ